MKHNKLFQDSWTSISIDSNLHVVGLSNPQDTLFFGVRPSVGAHFAAFVSDDNFVQRQIESITKSIHRTFDQRRNLYTNYISVCNGGEFAAALHIEYHSDSLLKLYVMGLDMGDLSRTAECCEYALGRSLEREIFENVPVGIEIYDRVGKLIDINDHELKILGVKDKSDIIGLDLYANPNISDQVKSQLRLGESIQFSSDYDFELANAQYYTSSKNSKRHFMVSVAVMHDAKGEIDKYILTVQDITQRVIYQQQYETLYKQNRTLLDLIPVGVGLYSSDGRMVYCNQMMEQISGVKFEDVDNAISPYNNPSIPDQFKQAMRDKQPIEISFEYDFGKINQSGYLSLDSDRVIQLKCMGCPVVGADDAYDSYMLVVEDVTEAMAKEERLHSNRQRTSLAIKDADIMLWEFDVEKQVFYSENEPINDFNPYASISVDTYIEVIHEQDREKVREYVDGMIQGKNLNFTFEARVRFPNKVDWQYCVINGSPYSCDSNGRVTRFVGSRKNNSELQRRKVLQDNILNSLPIPVHIKDMDNNSRYIFCNYESTRMFGSRVDNTIYDVMSEEQVARIEKTDKEVFKTGEPYYGFERIELRDGRAYDTIVRKSIIYDGDRRLLLIVRWDQSLENDLQRRAKILTMSMEVMNAYTWFFDPITNEVSYGEGFDRDGRNVQLVNTLPKYLDNMHPSDRESFVQSLNDMVSGRSTELCIEYRIDLTSCGRYEWWETRGLIEASKSNNQNEYYMIGMSVNIDSHKKTELALRKNTDELDRLIVQNEMVLNNTNSGLAYITADYIVQWENISKCSTSLSSEAYKKGELCYKSAHGRSTPCENCVLQRAIVSREVEQIQFVLYDNHKVEVFGTPVFCPDGEFDGIVIRVDDVTERQQMIDELRDAKSLAEQSDKLKSAFLANMSHEIRTPLNAIVGFSELLMTTDDSAESDEYIQIINTNNELLLKLISDILDLSKIEAGSVELKYDYFDLSEYFDSLELSMRQRITDPKITLVAHNPYPYCMVYLDRNRVAQLITNYVTNSIKYTPSGTIEMGYECIGKCVRIYVKDTGIGIHDDKKEKVFHRFEKLDEFAQGTGLGLSICKAIAESMGGSVGFESQFDHGSTFWALLPCDFEIVDYVERADQVAVCATSLDQKSNVSEESKRKTILIAEDISSNYLLISAMLKKHFDLLHAENGEQAVALAQTNNVDLVLMDMKMPKMDGLHATAEIRKFDHSLPIVALTAHAFESDRRAALEAGCNDYLVKPIDKAKLMSILRKYCS